MTQNSKIEWCDHTFNPWMGCTKVSPGCKHCYAETMLDHRYGKVVWGPQGTRVRTTKQYWKQPLKWNKQRWVECTVCSWRGVYDGEAICPGCDHPMVRVMKDARQRVFCASLADVFEDKAELMEWRIDLFRIIKETPNVDWLILTKRPENVIAFMDDACWPETGCPIFGEDESLPENVWIGTSVENQKTARERIPALQKISAHVRFLSCEPLLDLIDLSDAVEPDSDAWDEVNADWDEDDEPEEFVEECEAELDWVNFGNDLVHNPEHLEWVQRRCARAGFKTLKHGVIDWVICGGESGPNARPMHPGWAESLRHECQQAGIPFFFKQWGEWAPGDAFKISDHSTFKHKPMDLRGTMMYRVGKAMAGRLLDGKEWSQFPNEE